MILFIVLTVSVTLVVGVENTTSEKEDYSQYDEYDSEPPLCQEKGGRLSKYFIDHYILEDVNALRARLLNGSISNGIDGERYPRGKYMYKLEWSCKLERYAIKALGGNCSQTIPTAPWDYTGLFYKRSTNTTVPVISAAFFLWSEQSSHKVPKKYLRGDAVRYPESRRNFELLNLGRASTKKIGCAETLCQKGGVNRYRAFCVTDQPALVTNETIYEKGKGGCPHHECPSGSSCTSEGLCKWKREMTSTTLLASTTPSTTSAPTSTSLPPTSKSSASTSSPPSINPIFSCVNPLRIWIVLTNFFVW